MLTEYFNRLIDKQKAIGYQIVNGFQPTADGEDIAKTENALGLKFNNELIELYSRVNGMVSQEIIPGYVLMSLENAAAYYEQYIDFATIPDMNPNSQPGSKLFPFLEDGCGDCYWVDLNLDSPHYGNIFWTNTMGDPHDYEYESLTSLFHTIVECYETGVIRMEAEGMLDCDFHELGRISRRLNPGMKRYWDKYLGEG